MGKLSGGVSRVDAFQRRHRVIGFPIAVIYKYFDDQGPYLAAAMTYYAFIAIFPLMLIGTSILGIVLRNQPELQQEILDSTLAQFPIIGDELGRPEGLTGSFTAITIGLLTALFGAQGLGQALQNTQHVAWSVPRNSRPNPIFARVKTLGLLVVAGMSLLLLSVFTVLASSTDVLAGVLAEEVQDGIPFLTILVTAFVLTALLRVAATGQHSFARAAPGGIALAFMWHLLQIVGTAYVENVLVGTSSMTKTFGLVLGLIGFLWLGTSMAVISMEINVVLAKKLYPRALLTPFTDSVVLTDADRRAYAAYAAMQRHKGFEKVTVTWEKPKVEADTAAADQEGPQPESPEPGWPESEPAEPEAAKPEPAESEPAEPEPAEPDDQVDTVGADRSGRS